MGNQCCQDISHKKTPEISLNNQNQSDSPVTLNENQPQINNNSPNYLSPPVEQKRIRSLSQDVSPPHKVKPRLIPVMIRNPHRSDTQEIVKLPQEQASKRYSAMIKPRGSLLKLQENMKKNPAPKTEVKKPRIIVAQISKFSSSKSQSKPRRSHTIEKFEEEIVSASWISQSVIPESDINSEGTFEPPSQKNVKPLLSITSKIEISNIQKLYDVFYKKTIISL